MLVTTGFNCFCVCVRVSTKVMTFLPPLLLNVALDRVSCLVHQIVTLSSSTRIIGAPVSHMFKTVAKQNGECCGHMCEAESGD